MMLQRTHRGESILFQRWRWKDPSSRFISSSSTSYCPAPTRHCWPILYNTAAPEHIHVSSRELVAVMDAVCTLATNQASLDERMARAKVTLAQNHAMLLRIMSHLGLPPISVTKPTQSTTREQSAVSAAVASLDILAAAATASDPPASTPRRE